jgi:NADPH2:quinone reductase
VRAVVCHELGNLDRLSVDELPEPVPGAFHVVVEVTAAGVNFVDALIASGGYQLRPEVPYVPGGEVAGIVTALGADVRGVEIGQRVVGLCGLTGGFAERALVPYPMLFELPDALSEATGAAMLQAYGTAAFALEVRTKVLHDEWVLVLGAGGGVGLAMCDLASALGAKVIAAASSDEKLAAARERGAVATISYERDDLKALAREISGGGVDVVVDCVGGDHADGALRSLRTFGRYLVVGFAAGRIPSVALNHVLLNNRSVIGVDWGGWSFREPLRNREILERVLTMAGDGLLHPARPAERGLDEARQVFGDLLERRVAGKVVLRP